MVSLELKKLKLEDERMNISKVMVTRFPEILSIAAITIVGLVAVVGSSITKQPVETIFIVLLICGIGVAILHWWAKICFGE